jgi:hypothetical protein
VIQSSVQNNIHEKTKELVFSTDKFSYETHEYKVSLFKKDLINNLLVDKNILIYDLKHNYTTCYARSTHAFSF